MTTLKIIVSNLYNNFLTSRHKLVRQILPAFLILSIILGAGYRSIILKDRFRYEKEALAWIVNMASNYTRAPGKYSGEDAKFIRENPDKYIYTIGKSEFEPKSAMSSEIGWPLILRIILKEGIKGLDGIALFIVRYQVMIDLFVIILLFWAGKRIAGSAGACLAPLLYGIFKMPMVLMSEPYYYYWTIPFSVLSLIFWTIIYRPENKKIKLHWKYLSFFTYGIFIGFASFVRLYFMFLPLFMTPFICMREKAIKKGLVLLMIILLGQSVFVVPQILYNKKNFGEYTLTTRGHWHLFLQGVGLYPDNPWGIPDSGEINLNKWAVERGAPDMFSNHRSSERWFKKEYFKMFREHPEFFIEKFFKHLRGGLTVSTADFNFFGLIDEHSTGMYRFITLFPWMLLSAFILLFILAREQFWIGVAVFLQGLYLLLTIVTWFGNYPPFIASYIPVFVLLLAMSIAVHIKAFIALIEGGVWCWVNNNDIRRLPQMVIDCYRKDWSMEHIALQDPMSQAQAENLKTSENKLSVETTKSSITSWIIILGGCLSIILVISILIVTKKGNYAIKDDLFGKGKLYLIAHTIWTMDDDIKDNIKDKKGKHDALSIKTEITEGRSGKARYFNGKDSYIKTPLNFRGWKAITISLWVKPEQKDNSDLSVILDNGHDANSNFAIQSADINNPNNDRWVFHFNGVDIFLTLPFNQWTHIVVIADEEKGIIKAYINDVEVANVATDKDFEFGAEPLSIGKLAKSDARYFKGSIDEVIILNRVVGERW